MNSFFKNKFFDDNNTKECRRLYNTGLKLISPILNSELENIRYKTKFNTKKREIEKNEKALSYFDKSLKICDKKSFFRNKIMSTRSSVLFLLEKYEEVIQISDEIINSNIDDKKILLNAYTIKIGSLFFLERYEYADKCCDMALSIFPDDAFVIAFKAKALYKLDKYAKSIEYCDKALGIFDKACTAWKTKIYCLEKLGRYEESLRCLDEFSKNESSKHYDLDEEKEILITAIEK